MQKTHSKGASLLASVIDVEVAEIITSFLMRFFWVWDNSSNNIPFNVIVVVDRAHVFAGLSTSFSQIGTGG